MKEVKVVAWCDDEQHEQDDEMAEATNSFTVSVDGDKPREVDLCDEHALSFIEVFTVLEERGTIVDPPKPKKKQPRLKVDGTPARGGRQPEDLPNPPCPECGRQFHDRKALGTHSREVHGKKLIDLLPPELLGISDRKRLEKRAREVIEAQAS